MTKLENFKETAVGPIPSDWEAATVAEVARITTGSRNTQDKVEDGQFPFFVRSQTVERINSFSFDGEAVLTAGDGVGTGKVFHYINGPFDCHQRVYRISDFTDKMNGFYFYKYFSASFYDRIMSMTAKSSVDSVRREMISDMAVPLPPIEEQVAIASALKDIDGLIASLDALIAKKRDIKQAAMQQLLTGKTRLPGFKGKWDEVSFGSVAQIRNDKRQTLNDPAARFCVELENVEQADGRLTGFSDASSRKSIKYQFTKGDVLFGRLRPYLRKYWLAENGGVCSTEIWPLVAVKGRMDSSLLYQIIQSDAFIEVASTAYGTHMPRADWSVVRKFPVSLPRNVDEQIAIGEVLGSMEREYAKLDNKRKKLEIMKEGMMQQLLTGRIRLA